VDDLDSGGGLMTNKNKSLASESDGDMVVVGSLMGGAGKVPLVRKLNGKIGNISHRGDFFLLIPHL